MCFNFIFSNNMFCQTRFVNLYILITFTFILCDAQNAITSNPKEHFLEDDKEYTWTSAKYPDPYPADASEDLLITADPGYSIIVIIESLELDGLLTTEKSPKPPDLLIMNPGTSLDKKDNKLKVFVFSLRSERKYAIHTNNVYFSFQVTSGNINKKKGFKIRYKRIGEIVTTTTGSPTTVVTWPTPSGSESIYHSGFVHGKNQNEFSKPETLTELKTAISNMARKYCEYNNIETTEEISEKNVRIQYLVECPNTWPDSEICINIRFAVPILYEESSLWSGYQLNADNLAIMWDTYGDDYLKISGMKIYEEPNNKFAFKNWIIISCIMLILFLIALIALKCALQYTSNTNRKRRLSDIGIMTQEPKDNKISLTPHPHQITPPLFENDYSFDTYEPDEVISRTYNSSMGNQNFSYSMDSEDDDTDIDIYNSQHFSNSRHSDAENTNRETDI